MVCQPCQAAGNITTAAYGRRIMGEGHSYRERQWDRVAYKECGEQLAVGSLLSHLMTQYGRAVGRQS